MKFTQLALIGIATAVIATGCAAPVEPEPVGPPAVVEGEKSPESQVEDLSTVSFTVPREFVLEETEADIEANLEARGYLGFVVNADQSVTYTMSTDTRDRQLQGLRNSLQLIIEQAVNQNPDVFLTITHDPSLTSFDVTVNRAAYEGQTDPSPIGDILGIQGMFYQLFQGIAVADQQPVLTRLIDEATNETFETLSYIYEG